MSGASHISWDLLTSQKERLVRVGRRQGNAFNRWGRAFTRAGPAVNEAKGQPVHLTQGPGKWTCDLSPPQGLNNVVPDAQAADAQVSASWFPV